MCETGAGGSEAGRAAAYGFEPGAQRHGGLERLCTFQRWLKTGAGEGIRTLDPNLGKVVLYP